MTSNNASLFQSQISEVFMMRSELTSSVIIATIQGCHDKSEHERRTPRVSVVVVARRNEIRHLQNLISTLQRQTFGSYELILVDNSRSTELRDCAKSFHSKLNRSVFYVPNRDSGYTGGNVLGVNYASGELVFILNPDTKLENGTIGHLKREFDNHGKRVMVLVPKVLIRNSNLLNSIGMKRMRPSENLYVNIGYLEEDRGQYDYSRRVEAFDGAAFMFRKALLEHTYLFDPRFYFGHETTDLSERLKKLGFEIWTCPTAVVRHYIRGSVQSEKTNTRLNVLLVRNILVHTLRNMGWAMFWRTLIVAICYRNIIWPIVTRNENFRSAFTYAGGVFRFTIDLGLFHKPITT